MTPKPARRLSRLSSTRPLCIRRSPRTSVSDSASRPKARAATTRRLWVRSHGDAHETGSRLMSRLESMLSERGALQKVSTSKRDGCRSTPSKWAPLNVPWIGRAHVGIGRYFASVKRHVPAVAGTLRGNSRHRAACSTAIIYISIFSSRFCAAADGMEGCV